jgi:hypothetical protein
MDARSIASMQSRCTLESKTSTCNDDFFRCIALSFRPTEMKPGRVAGVRDAQIGARTISYKRVNLRQDALRKSDAVFRTAIRITLSSANETAHAR